MTIPAKQQNILKWIAKNGPPYLMTVTWIANRGFHQGYDWIYYSLKQLEKRKLLSTAQIPLHTFGKRMVAGWEVTPTGEAYLKDKGIGWWKNKKWIDGEKEPTNT